MRIVSSLLLLTIASLQGSSVDDPYPKVAASGGSAFFVMLPGTPPHGIAYFVSSDGTFHKLWEVHGWYSYLTFLSREGDYLVSVDKIANAESTDTVLSFYKQGTLIRAYSASDLVRKLPPDGRWYKYSEGISPQLDYMTFSIDTIDGKRHSFDIRTGNSAE